MARGIGRAASQHGQDDVAVLTGQGDDRRVVLLGLCPLAIVGGLGSGVRKEANAARSMAFFSRWLPLRLRDSPFTDFRAGGSPGQAGVGSQLVAAVETRAVIDLGQDRRASTGADRGHGRERPTERRGHEDRLDLSAKPPTARSPRNLLWPRARLNGRYYLSGSWRSSRRDNRRVDKSGFVV